MGKAVEEILRQIDALSEDERAALDEQLEARLEQRWRAAAAEARRLANQRGLTQNDIDRAVEKARYGE